MSFPLLVAAWGSRTQRPKAIRPVCKG